MANETVYYNLAPSNLAVKRDNRFDGGGFDISLEEVAHADALLVTDIYQAVKKIYDLWLYMREQPNYDLLQEQLQEFSRSEYISMIQSLGRATLANTTNGDTPKVRRAIHDIRGGALTSLIGYAHLILKMPTESSQKYIRQAVFLARDHAKMMRNILPNLDRPTRLADESTKLHDVHEFVDKWDGFTFDSPDKQVQVVVASEYEGFITNRCLETSAVDRILYNYINNAARFSSKKQIQLTVIPINKTVTRWVVENGVTQQQETWLRENLEKGLKQLFYGGITRGGHGVGLSSCVDLVAASFGVKFEKAVEDAYLGAHVQNSTYYAWFHWPAYVCQGEHEPVCDCHE